VLARLAFVEWDDAELPRICTDAARTVLWPTLTIHKAVFLFPAAHLAAMPKVVMLGSNSGKACLVNRIITNTFLADSTPTVGAAYAQKTVRWHDTDLRLDIWDTAGFEVFRCVAPMHYQEARAVIVVFDLSTRIRSPMRANGWTSSARRGIPMP
jgi:hypothetical protein